MTNKILLIFLLALGLTACGVTSTAPLDDVYYWPDKKAPVEETPTPDTDSMEYINVQDTTVTIRIKR